jgi:hypothetical protein
MKTLYDTATADVVKARLKELRPDSQRLWGKMSATQMVEHCARGMEWAVDDVRPPRLLVGRILGPIVRPLALKDDAPMRRNSPTSPLLVVREEGNLDAERERLCSLIDRFVAGGTDACTKHPHSFFGKMTAHDWGVLTYKHLDHHLRQFGA